jgi:D-cysteine desulfhydrase
VLATTYFGARAGFQVEAVIVPQPRSDHAVEVLRASLALGLIAFPVRSWAAAPIALAARAARGARFVGLGGSSVAGSMGYVAAARELASQVRNGVMPEPDVCVVALGSGGTAAGLSAGFAAEGMKTRVIGVCVATPILVVRSVALTLAWACARRVGVRAPLASMRARMEVDARFLGRGYGYSTAEAERAMDAARDGAGLTLDPTYTAKTFAAALAHARAGRHRVVLYWHTLSSAPMRPLLSGAPSEGDLAPSLRALWAAP